MSSMFERWAHDVNAQVEFDTSLFEMTEEERVEIYGEDPVETLREMTPEERISRYGVDYSDFL